MTPSLRSVLVVVAAGFWGTPSDAAILVKNTKDSGPGSLRDAIVRANMAPGPESITFAISGTPPHTIAPKSPLPPITNTVSIVGPKRYEVVLAGSQAGYPSGVGLDLQGTGSTVTSMVVNNRWFCGIRLGGGGYHKLDLNRIGPDADGVTALPISNYEGVCVESSHNQIGVGGRNVISGNTNAGVRITDGTWNQVQGNYIGPGASGQSLTSLQRPQTHGVLVNRGNRNTLTSNLIAGSDGVFLESTSSNVIVANKICTTADGKALLDDSRWGISLGSGATDNVIGSTVPGGENVIAHCQVGGIYVGDTSRGNSIRGNRIHGIGGLSPLPMAIELHPYPGPNPNDPQDLDSGGNDLQNTPRILDAVSDGITTSVFGELESRPFSSYVVDVYASPVDPGDGSCETPSFLGSTSFTTDAAGRAFFFLSSPIPVPWGQFLGATATAATGPANTSEVSACRAVRPPI